MEESKICHLEKGQSRIYFFSKWFNLDHSKTLSFGKGLKYILSMSIWLIQLYKKVKCLVRNKSETRNYCLMQEQLTKVQTGGEEWTMEFGIGLPVLFTPLFLTEGGKNGQWNSELVYQYFLPLYF